MNIPDIIREKAGDFGDKELEDYVERVHKLLRGMKPGDSFVIAKLTRENNRDLFIECCKWYMRLHNEDYQDGLSFGKGFGVLTKYDLAFIKGAGHRAQGTGEEQNTGKTNNDVDLLTKNK